MAKDVPQQRAKHQDEIDLERDIRLLSSRVRDLEEAVVKRKADEKKKKELEEIAERKRKAEEKKRAKTLRSKLKEIIKKRSEFLDEAELGKDEVDGLISLKLNQKKEFEMKRGEQTGGPESKPEGKPEKKPRKNEDELELEQLKDKKLEKEKQLTRTAGREDANFEKEKRRAKQENTKLIDRAAARKTINTLRIAIEFEWNKSKIEQLAQKLDKVRNLLYSEVMLNMQRSISKLRKGQGVMEDMFQVQASHLQLMDDNASRRHDAVLQAIDSFTDVLKNSQWLFPALPKILTEADPSLKTAALTGYSAIESAVLAALHFRKMDTRETQVQEAYPETCSWIFEDPQECEQRWSSFREWLEAEEDRCYWVGGKPGCGKSTLMKFLYSDPRTLAALNRWAGDSCELIKASFFCWRAGTPLQRNQEGLLRSLLHAILTQKRDLISRVFPRQYNAMMTQ